MYINNSLTIQDVTHLFNSEYTIVDFFSTIANNDYALFFDSNQESKKSAFSLFLFAPFIKVKLEKNCLSVEEKLGNIKSYNAPSISTVKNKLKELLSKYAFRISEQKRKELKEITPFIGGAAGLLSYELLHYIEEVVSKNDLKQDFPALCLGLYDTFISYNHVTKKVFLINCGVVSDKSAIKNNLNKIVEEIKAGAVAREKSTSDYFSNYNSACVIKEDFTKKEYNQAIKAALDYIYAGDVFEVNIAKTYSCVLPEKLSKSEQADLSYNLYLRGRAVNHSSFASFFNFTGRQVASFSPERFLSTDHLGNVIAEPIKGTIASNKDLELDRKAKTKLLTSIKDRAENIMIVDLMRNDLSKVCEASSVKVTKLCELETFANLHHLVSKVEGKLIDGYDLIDLLWASFPGGSIAGAPKVRAMQIISELESRARCAYCGSMVYLGFDGVMDSSILIRSYLTDKNQISFSAGSAIVSDTNIEQEHAECSLKAKALYNNLIEFYGINNR